MKKIIQYMVAGLLLMMVNTSCKDNENWSCLLYTSNSCKWRQYPEITQTMRIGTQCGKDTADVGTLQCIGYLYAEKAKADIPQLPKTQIRFYFHGN